MDEKDSERIEIEQYFSAEQWSSMCEYEKTRYRNMKENYNRMLEFGASVICILIQTPCCICGEVILINDVRCRYTRGNARIYAGIV